MSADNRADCFDLVAESIGARDALVRPSSAGSVGETRAATRAFACA
jgi:hypothetical protein